MRFVQSSCLMSTADSLSQLEKPEAATKALSKSQQLLSRRATLNDRLKARYQYLAAQISAQNGKRDESDAALRTAFEAQRTASIGLFRSGLVDERFEEGSFTERIAALLYEKLLADPTDADWQNDPLESFVLLTTDRTRSFENWFQSVLATRRHSKGDRNCGPYATSRILQQSPAWWAIALVTLATGRPRRFVDRQRQAQETGHPHPLTQVYASCKDKPKRSNNGLPRCLSPRTRISWSKPPRSHGSCKKSANSRSNCCTAWR